MKRIEGVTRAQSTAARIRRMIIEGHFKPGERLQVQRLADQLGVSRTPVTDALSALHKEGLLEYGAHRGYGVRLFSVKNFLDGFDVRMTLEGLAARTIAERGIKRATADALADNLQRTNAVLYGPEWGAVEMEEWRVLNLQFHDLLLAEADNMYILQGVQAVRAVPPLFNVAYDAAHSELWPLLELSFCRQALSDHHRIADAVCAGQGTRAENMMREHIYASREKVRGILEKMGES
jgi:GntR family transcriptional regulator of vanillate catabolism